MSKKNIIRIGDRVKIINPDFFIRCGYPMSFTDTVNSIMDKENELLCNMARMVSEKPAKGKLADKYHFTISPEFHERDLKKFAHAIAYMRMRQNGFGGKTRAIHTERMDEYQNMVFVVYSKKVCKTGEYYGPSGGCDYFGEYDYEPGGLKNEQTHIILEAINGLMIEAKNVIKIKKEDDGEGDMDNEVHGCGRRMSPR